MKHRDRARAQVRALRGQPDAAVLELAITTYERGDTFLAYEILRAAPRALAAATARDLDRLSTRLDSWESVDCFASFGSGVAWRLGRISDATIARYARSKDRWRRRAALASTIPLNTRARGATQPDPERTLAVCTLLVEDRDDMVVKALSWALRELAKRDPGAVRRWLADHTDRAAPRVLREVRNKLATGLKNPTAKPRASRR